MKIQLGTKDVTSNSYIFDVFPWPQYWKVCNPVIFQCMKSLEYFYQITLMPWKIVLVKQVKNQAEKMISCPVD